MIFIGSFALIFISLPIPAYQSFMKSVFGTAWENIFLFLRDGTFNILSLLMVVTISYSYVIEKGETDKRTVNPVIASSVSLCSFVATFGISKKGFSIANYGVEGACIAIVVAITSSLLFIKLSSVKMLQIKAFTDGDSATFSSALASIFPAAITISVYAVLNQGLSALFGINDLQTFLSGFISGIITKIHSPLVGAILFILLIHILWFLGVHGNNVLEPVAQSIFVPALALNQQLIKAGHAPTQIFTKTFFDTFVLMGGCGAGLCLVTAIFVAGRNKNQHRIAKLSIIPLIFNMNELVIFGIPIVLNPIYIIPFLFVPFILTLTSFSAIHLGIVPYTRNPVEWTTPIFLSGYVSTGSIRGCLLQLFNLLLGTACYIPFVKLSQTVSNYQMKNNLSKLYTQFKKVEESGAPSDLLGRHDEIGNIARALASDLKNDLQTNNISLFYQPQVDYNGSIFGAEALLRWSHSAYGPIYPPLVIALASEANFIDKLGCWIFNRACSDLKHLQTLGLKNFTVSVNVSAVQLENPAFVMSLTEIIHKNQIDPGFLKIEITEQIALASSPKVKKQLMAVKELGIKLEMDDFGMGHSSLMYLKEYDFDTIKLDGSLVREVCQNSTCQNIISSIVYLSKSMGYAVLAEYVETEEQRNILHTLGCDRCQGYLFNKALTVRDLFEYIIHNCLPENNKV